MTYFVFYELRRVYRKRAPYSQPGRTAKGTNISHMPIETGEQVNAMIHIRASLRTSICYVTKGEP
jgi:hypothetical protein